MTITSLQNPRLKQIKSLEKSANRKDSNLFVVEGMREICLAAKAGYTLQTIYICEELLTQSEEYNLEKIPANVETFYFSKEAYQHVAYRESTEGIIAIANQKAAEIEQLILSKNPVILVIEGVEKPGNLGAMLRSADAANVDAVILCDTRTDIYNPNVIRSSIGTVFTNQIAIATPQETLQFFKKNKIQSYAAALTAKEIYYEKDFKTATAFVVGTEATGISEDFLCEIDTQIKIPMLGKIDSLNVSVCAAILLFETQRQRSK